jgi:small GTP-binding protein
LLDASVVRGLAGTGTAIKELKSKICLVGEKSVGKTSLIRRFVLDTFDDRYVVTVGTKITKKEVSVFKPELEGEVHIDMTIWDIMGEKGFRELLKDAYFYGANGVLAVADLTRKKSLDDLDDWIDGVEKIVGKVPIFIAVNKCDLIDQAQFSLKEVSQLAKAFDSDFLHTSAKTGEGVEQCFKKLGDLVVAHQLGA